MIEEVVHVVFDGPPGPVAGRFIETENPAGRSIRVGEWHERADGLWELRIPTSIRPGRYVKMSDVLDLVGDIKGVNVLKVTKAINDLPTVNIEEYGH